MPIPHTPYSSDEDPKTRIRALFATVRLIYAMRSSPETQLQFAAIVRNPGGDGQLVGTFDAEQFFADVETLL
jgi:hypothetical protein